jgi:glycosyltransferase involved in cell wall biosynthesis
MTGYTFTVFTPAYNRAHTLPRVFQSLQRQTFRDFEWLIVDDGSTDHTRDVVTQLQAEAGFPIRYLLQPHSGKHVAFNRGVREAAGELFLSLDSDDRCLPEALERFKFHWDAIPTDRKAEFSAVTALWMDENGRVVGDRFPKDTIDSDSLELTFKFHVRGDKWGFHRTSVLRENPFPEPPGLMFVPESVVWYAIARRHKTRFVNECLGVCHNGPLAGDRLSRLTTTTALGRRFAHLSILNDYRDVHQISLGRRARSALNYGRYSFLCAIGVLPQILAAKSIQTRVLLVFCAPAAYLLSQVDRCRGVGTSKGGTPRTAG